MASTAFAAGFSNIARAAEAGTDCTIAASDVAAIAAIETDPSLSASEELTQELAARKALLSKVIACAENNVTEQGAALNNITVPSAASNVQSILAGKLNDATNYYNAELAKVSTAGIAGTKEIAQEVLSWNTANYDPLAEEIANLDLWSHNQALFTTAQNRMNQTNNIVSFLESAGQNTALEGDLSTTQADFQSALAEHNVAENALAESLPPDQALALIQQSLADLATAYQDFSTINNLIQTLLPTNAN